jgi:hypothetical protein
VARESDENNKIIFFSFGFFLAIENNSLLFSAGFSLTAENNKILTKLQKIKKSQSINICIHLSTNNIIWRSKFETLITR